MDLSAWLRNLGLGQYEQASDERMRLRVYARMTARNGRSRAPGTRLGQPPG